MIYMVNEVEYNREKHTVATVPFCNIRPYSPRVANRLTIYAGRRLDLRA